MYSTFLGQDQYLSIWEDLWHYTVSLMPGQMKSKVMNISQKEFITLEQQLLKSEWGKRENYADQWSNVFGGTCDSSEVKSVKWQGSCKILECLLPSNCDKNLIGEILQDSFNRTASLLIFNCHIWN